MQVTLVTSILISQIIQFFPYKFKCQRINNSQLVTPLCRQKEDNMNYENHIDAMTKSVISSPYCSSLNVI